VHLSFPDSHRRQRVSGDTWRVQLLPLQARPTCGCSASRHALTHRMPHRAVLVAHAARVMHAARVARRGGRAGDSGARDARGRPAARPRCAPLAVGPTRTRTISRISTTPTAGLANSIALRVDGALRSARPPSLPQAAAAAPGAIAAPAALQGRVALRISADIPPIFALTPGLDAVVVSILDAILGRLEAALRRGLLEDYDLWVREQKAAQRAAAAAAIETQP
jgi:hypothetical protein